MIHNVLKYDRTNTSYRIFSRELAPAILLFLVCHLASLWLLSNRVQFNDDAYITFRVAENLANGNGPYYNPNEKLQASTSPLYVLILSLGHKITGMEVVQFENLLQPIWINIIAILLFAIARSIPELRATAILLPIFLVISPFEYMNVKGMESFLFSALILLAILMEIRRAPILCGLAIGLAACTRTEGGVLGPIYLLYWFAGRFAYGHQAFSMKDLKRTILSAILVGLPILIFVCIAYGSPLPQSVQGKINQVGTTWMRTMHGAWFEYLFFVPPNGWKHPSPWGITLVAGILVAIFKFKKQIPDISFYRGFMLAGFIIIIHGGIFIVFKAPVYGWYLYPTKILLLPFYALSLITLLNFTTNKCFGKIPSIISRTLATLLMTYILYTHTLQFQILNEIAKSGHRGDKGYIRVAKLLRDSQIPADWKFASFEVGILGYYSGMRCLDLAGLISPECRKYFNKEPFSVIALRFMPELYIATLFPELKETTTNQAHREKFLQSYRLIDTHIDETEVRIYCRKDLNWSPIRSLADQPL